MHCSDLVLQCADFGRMSEWWTTVLDDYRGDSEVLSECRVDVCDGRSTVERAMKAACRLCELFQR